MEGLLKKKGARRGIFGDSWKERYFVLDGATLRYYAGGSTEGELKGEVTIAGVDPREELQGKKGHKPNRFDFQLADGGVVLCASAPSAADRSSWIDAGRAASGARPRKLSAGLRPETLEFFEHVHGIMVCIDTLNGEWGELTAACPGALQEGYEFDHSKGGDDGTGVRADCRQQRAADGEDVQSIDELYAAAEAARGQYVALLERLPREVDGVPAAAVEVAALKSRERVEEKVRDSYGGCYWRLGDVNRGRFMCDTVAQAEAAARWIAEHADVVAAKNKFAKPTAMGDRFLLFKIRLRVGGGGGEAAAVHMCEVQVRVRSVHRLVEELHGHWHYEYFRSYFAGGGEASAKARVADLRELEEVVRRTSSRLQDATAASPSGVLLDDAFVNRLLRGDDAGRLGRTAALLSDKLCEYELARRLRERALQLARDGGAGGGGGGRGDGVEVADALVNTGEVLRQQGKLDEAMAKYEEARGIYVKAYGPNHADVAMTLNNMAKVLETQGKLDEALAKFREISRIYVDLYGQDHGYVAYAQNKVANVLRAQGKPEEC